MTTLGNRLIHVVLFAMALLAAPLPGHVEPGHGHEAAGEPAPRSAATRTVRIDLGDNFYTPRTVQVAAGEAVRFVLTNRGQLLHEFNIGTAAMHARHQKEMLAMMESGVLTPTGPKTDMMKMDHARPGHHPMGHDEVNSVLVEPGQTAELVWRFPQATALEFACNVPGHYEAGMVGAFEFTGSGRQQ